MRLLTVSNLYPRPDQPRRGLFNAQQFRALNAQMRSGDQQGGGVRNVCIVPEWRTWRWAAIRRWRDPFQTDFDTRYVPVFYLPVAGRSCNWRFYLASLASEVGLFQGCDGVLATWLYPDAVAVERLAHRAPGLPLWIKVHGSDRFHLDVATRRAVILRSCAGSAGVICVSESIAAALRKAGVPEGKVHVVPNGVDHERFRFRPAGEAAAALGPVGASQGRLTVLYVGNLVPVKGPDILLNAWPQVRRDCGTRGARLVIIGEGPMRRLLERMATRLAIADSVLFAGSIAPDAVARWMNAADCLCLPSLSEGMPNVVMEALVSGLPLVASAVGACSEMLAGEPCSRLVPPGDATALGRAICGVLTTGVERSAMASRNAKRFSWEQSAAELMQRLRHGRST